MKNLLPLILCWLLCGATAMAQATFTEQLGKDEAGKGRVVVRQSKEIDQVVNGNVSPKPAAKPEQKAEHKAEAKGEHNADPATPKNAEHHENKAKPASQGKGYTARSRHKARGFRICIFTGGNSRQDKAKAQQVGQQCRNKFGELAVYTFFQSPRWVTHVGDFATRKEAEKYVNLIRRAHFTYETRIVASEVNLPD